MRISDVPNEDEVIIGINEKFRIVKKEIVKDKYDKDVCHVWLADDDLV